MSFTIFQAQDQNFNTLQLEDLETGIRVKILPDFGAMLHEFSIPPENGRLQAVSSYTDLSDLQKHHSLFYRSAKLSPFPCRISKGRYPFEGKEYEFKNKFPDGSAIHGLLFNKPFTLIREAADKDQASVLLEYLYKKEDPGYPFDYKINVKYTLKKSGVLELNTVLTNLSPGRIPIADGWHPYFSLGGRVDDWQLTIHSKEILELDKTLAPTGKRIPFEAFRTTSRIGSFILDHSFLLDPDGDQPACVLYNPANRVRLSFFPDKEYPFLQVYIPEDRNSIAIENLSAAPDCFNNGIGLTLLEPGHSQSFTVQYRLDFQ